MKSTSRLPLLTLAIFATVVILFASPLFAKFHDRKIFVSKFGGQTKSLADLQHVRAAVRSSALASLKEIPQSVKAELVAHADAEMKHGQGYVVLTAHDFMEFFRNGNRMHYQDKLHSRRERVSVLLIAHLLDRETHPSSTKYVDEIVNGVWMLLEESTWCYPAHLSLQGTHDHLPDPNHVAVDLNAGEVAKFLAWVKLLMHEQFDKVSPVVNRRIDFELKRRIFEAYLKVNFGWEGFGVHHSVNNWNIWVNGNILKSAIFTLDDHALFTKVLNKTLHSADYFLDGYGEDGGCDEGPAYWRQAGGRLIEFLESMDQLFPEAKQYFASHKLIHLIGEYSYKMRITGNWFVNFADAIPLLTYPPSLLYKYGQLFEDKVMKQYAAFMMTYVGKGSTKEQFLRSMIDGAMGGDLNEFWNFVITRKGIEAEKAEAPEADLVWLPDIQVFNARSKKTVAEKARFFLAGKAGSNHESHNHNDVGNFILFQGGHPVLIDIGVGTYTAQTFNSHRYELFYMQSQYHNCPDINGVQQKAGGAFAAHNASLTHSSSSVHFSADIAGAYPKEAHVKHWHRSLAFDLAANSISLEDKYTLEKFLQPQAVHFITPHSVKISKTATGLALSGEQGVKVLMTVDWKVFELKEEVKSLGGDHHLTHVWGESVKRFTLHTKDSHKELNGHFVFKFEAGH